MIYTYSYASPLGNILLTSDGRHLTGLWFQGQKYFGASWLSSETELIARKGIQQLTTDKADDAFEKTIPADCEKLFSETSRWLALYFEGKIPDFTPPLSFQGTPFQKAVWEILLTIPYGETMTYKEIAKRIAVQRGVARMSAQAVGGAVGHNPISLIVPCHRVIGTNGSLTGYAGGLDKKTWLLNLEKSIFL